MIREKKMNDKRRRKRKMDDKRERVVWYNKAY